MTAPATAPAPAVRRQRGEVAPIPFTRVLDVELRKMFDTRSGFWLMASIVILSVVATAATIVFAPASDLDFETFASAIGIPMSVILPMIAILSVTGEWSQRTGLATFTMVPSRSRVIAAKWLLTVLVGVAGMAVALGVGALGNLVGSSIAGADVVWNISAREFGQIVLANSIGMLIGFTLGVLLRSSAAGIVGYFVYALVLPGVSSALASSQQWWADHGAWFDLNMATYPLYDTALTSEQWAQLGATAAIWLVLPMVVGVWAVLRSEVK
ncbi:ABC-2 transporter permease [Nocardioides sambongensis]|uniref:ABC-2 transporter permease n=1 Tax=Nocardioides sambongensis TaxID=2589074 RepID=UPI0011290AC6|nr:ABC transporter permease subunit [Nocardioides sambongensis]